MPKKKKLAAGLLFFYIRTACLGKFLVPLFVFLNGKLVTGEVIVDLDCAYECRTQIVEKHFTSNSFTHFTR